MERAVSRENIDEQEALAAEEQVNQEALEYELGLIRIAGRLYSREERLYSILSKIAKGYLSRLFPAERTTEKQDIADMDLLYDDFRQTRYLSDADKEDILHDIYVEILRDPDHFLTSVDAVSGDSVRILKSWLRYRATKYIRSRSRQNSLEHDMASVDVTPCADAERNPDLLAQELAEETMHKRIKELVSLIHKGYSQEEIAKILKVTSRTLRNDLKVLKQALQGRIDTFNANQVPPQVPQAKAIPQVRRIPLQVSESIVHYKDKYDRSCTAWIEHIIPANPADRDHTYDFVGSKTQSCVVATVIDDLA